VDRGGGDAPVVVGLGSGGEFDVLVVDGEDPAFGGIDGGSGGHANWWGLVFRGIPRGISGWCQVSFRSFGQGTRSGRGRENLST